MTDRDDEATHREEATNREDADDGLTLWQLIGSAVSAAIGVQSSENRRRDFSRGRPGQFIAIGIIFTVVFVLLMVGVVNLVLRLVGN